MIMTLFYLFIALSWLGFWKLVDST